MANNDCLTNMQVLASYFSTGLPGLCSLFPWSVRGSCMLPPVFYPGQLLLPCWPPRPEANHPWGGRGQGPVGCPPGHWQAGQAAPFWARGDGGKPERHRLSPQTAAGSSAPPEGPPHPVTCLSNCSQEVSCCSLHCCSSCFCAPAVPSSCAQLTDRLLPGLLWRLGERLRDSPHTPSPGWWQWVGVARQPGPGPWCWRSGLHASDAPAGCLCPCPGPVPTRPGGRAQAGCFRLQTM